MITLVSLNTLIEDTCVLAVLAYLLARGETLQRLFSVPLGISQRLLLGVLLGALGTTEIIFPDARIPYVLHTLLVTFAVFRGGLLTGLISSLIIVCGFAFRENFPSLLTTMLALGVCLGAGMIARQIEGGLRSSLVALLCGAAAQAGVVIIYRFLLLPGASFSPLYTSGITIFANSFGLWLFHRILQDAQARADAERYRLEAERAHALATEAQLASLRARIHPHFLFNVLTSTAALCRISSESAEKTLINLSRLLRRSLDAPTDVPISVQTERESLQAYLEIEHLRLGERLKINWRVEADLNRVTLPAFALQTLVENAIQHGLAPSINGGTVTISIISRPRYTLFAVCDTGVGVESGREKEWRLLPERPEHGLQIVAQQLILQYGRKSRLRLFSEAGRGTLVVFALPIESSNSGKDTP